MEFTALPFILPGPNYADVIINGTTVKRLFFSLMEKRRFRIFYSSALVKADRKIEIGFSFSHRISPYEAGVSSDKRKLGMAIYDLVIRSTGFIRYNHL